MGLSENLGGNRSIFPIENVHFGSDTVHRNGQNMSKLRTGSDPGARSVAEKGALWLALHGLIHPTPA